MIKTQTFTSTSSLKLDEMIAEFCRQHNNIIKIQFSTCVVNNELTYSAMIMVEEEWYE